MPVEQISSIANIEVLQGVRIEWWMAVDAIVSLLMSQLWT